MQGEYTLVTVKKDLLRNYWTIDLYIAKFCRVLTTTVTPDHLNQIGFHFLHKLIPDEIL
jgi:hypothetical protein